MFERIDHVEVITSDMESSIEFYTDILGFKVKRRRRVQKPPMEEVAFLELNNMTIEMFSMKDAAPPSKEQWQIGYRRIALEVKDIDKAVGYLKAKGAKIVTDIRDLDMARLAVIEDPNGLPIEIVQWR